jgi:riboflavin synthase
MFTGLVEAVGTVDDVHELNESRRIRIRAPGIADELSIGESVSVDGACLTAVEVGGGAFAVEAIGTTLSRTIAGGYRAGTRVNLERALRLSDRLGGHLVQGHVDAVGELEGVRQEGTHRLLDFRIPPDVASVTILHGSIAINGVSLTVNALTAGGCQVAIIPHTWERTTLSDLRPGDPVNLEGDLIGKYVSRMAAAWGGGSPRVPAG